MANVTITGIAGGAKSSVVDGDALELESSSTSYYVLLSTIKSYMFDTVNASGDLLVGDADNSVTRLAAGSVGEVLTVTTGGVDWAAGGDVPAGGTTDQVLSKIDATDYNTQWVNASGNVATDTIWNAEGDLALGSGSNTAARLAIGTSGKYLKSNGTTASWETAPGTETRNVYNVVDDYGADPTGATSSQTEIQAAITAAGADDTIYFPKGTYDIEDGLVIDSTGGITFYGEGRYSTKLLFTPTTANQIALDISRSGGGDHTLGTYRDFQILTTDTTYDKTAIRLNTVSTTSFERIYIKSFYGNNTDSVGIETIGHETSQFKNIRIDAVVPIHHKNNPTAGHQELSVDMFHLEDLYLIAGGPSEHKPATLTSACILIDGDVYFSNYVIDGANVFVGGDRGFSWEGGGASSVGHQLALYNIRREQPHSAATDYSFYIAGEAVYPLQTLLMCNIRPSLEQKGVYLKYVDSAAFLNCHFANDYTTLGRPAIEVADTGVAGNVFEMQIISCYFLNAGKVLESDYMKMVSSNSALRPGALTQPYTCSYSFMPSSTYAQHGKVLLSDDAGVSTEWFHHGSLADNAKVQLPINENENILACMVEATATDTTSDLVATGKWICSYTTDGSSGVRLVSGYRAAEVTTDLNLCLYSAGAGLLAPVYLENKLGASADYYVKVTVYKSDET